MPTKVKETLQLSQAECGLACVHMIVRSFGSKESMTSLRSEFDTGRDGLSARHLTEALDSRGFKPSAYRTGVPGLRKLTGPFIVLVDDAHYCVVESIGKDYVDYVDPALGRQRDSLTEFSDRYSGVVIDAEPTDRFDPAAHRTAGPWRRVVTHLRAIRGRMAVIITLTLGTYAMALVTPLGTEHLINDAAANGFQGNSGVVVAVIAGVALSYFILLMVRAITSARALVVLSRLLMRGTFGRLLRLPYQYFTGRSTGELMYRLNSVSAVRDLMSNQLITGLFDIGALVFFVSFMFARSFELTLIALAFLVALCLILGFTRRRVQDAIRQEMSASAEANALQLESVVGIESLKLSGTEARFFRTWSSKYDVAMDRVATRLILQGRVNAAVAVIQVVAPLVVLGYGLVLYGRGSISLGTVIAVQALTASSFAIISTIFASYTQFLQADSYLDRIRDIDDSAPDPWPSDGVTDDINGRIDVHDVHFSYARNSVPAIDGVSLSIAAGSKVAIVGRSGSGKTTLGRLLCGLYEPTGGMIAVDGVRVREYDRERFYAQVGAVPQDVKLQNISIEDNIRLSVPDAPREEVERAAKAAQVHDDIMRMPLGYATRVSEMGMNLSGGQRQRIAIARTLMGDPRILLFDEATSSLDLLNEARVSAHLLSLDCTRIVIAHRLSTIVDADQIVVMSEGRIVERGTHSELMHKSGQYRELYERQADLESVSADVSL